MTLDNKLDWINELKDALAFCSICQQHDFKFYAGVDKIKAGKK